MENKGDLSMTKGEGVSAGILRKGSKRLNLFVFSLSLPPFPIFTFQPMKGIYGEKGSLASSDSMRGKPFPRSIRWSAETILTPPFPIFFFHTHGRNLW